VLRRTLRVGGGGSTAVVAHLDARGRRALSVFRERLVRVAPGQALLAVRQTSAAAAVDVLVDGKPFFRRVLAAGQRRAPLGAGTHSITVRPSGRGGPTSVASNVRLRAGEVAEVYVLGSFHGQTVQQLVHTYDPSSRAPRGADARELWDAFPLDHPPPR
jgi:hypothetical protein